MSPVSGGSGEYRCHAMDNTFESKIQEISRRVNIIDIVSEHVRLKKSGSNWVGLCPFHNEKTPSFSVSPDKGLFYCFGCGVGGNVFTFLMKTRGVTFSEALRELAKRAGVELPKRSLSPEQKKRGELKNKIFQINGLAEEFYTAMLKRIDGREALDYLKNERGLSDSAISEFRLGFAPDKWNGLVNFLTEKGIALEDAERAGLVLPRKDGSYFDLFRNRVIFPITDMYGNIVGFGGRVIKSGEPKYLNSPETPVFVKGRTFYGMEQTWGEIRRADEAFIVEGYFDLIMLYEKGIKNVLAPLGTALTQEHVHLLRGIIKRVYMLFDSDSAGMRAAERVLPLFLDSGIDALIILLPQGDDPDTFIKREGAEALLKLKERAIPLWEFYLNNMADRAGKYPWKKTNTIEEILRLVNTVSHPVARSFYLKQIAEKFWIRESELSALIKKMKGVNTRKDSELNIYSFNPREKTLIYVMYKYPQSIVKLSGYIDRIENEKLKGIAKFIADYYIKENGVNEGFHLHYFPDEYRNIITSISMEFGDIIDDESSAVERIIKDFERKLLEEEDRKLTAELRAVQETRDYEKMQHIINLKSELIKKRQEFLKK